MVSVLITGCAKEDVYCEAAKDALLGETFQGTIYLCNAQPPDAEWLEGTTKVTSMVPGQVSMQLTSDSQQIDTTMLFDYTCKVVETNIPIIDFTTIDTDDADSYQDGRILFRFGYPGCENSTHFEGLAQ